MSKIALVDDDRNILTSVAMTLEAEGFEVETYNDGQSALDLDAYWKPEENVSDLLDAKRELPTTKIETILDAGRQKSRLWRRAAAARP